MTNKKRVRVNFIFVVVLMISLIGVGCSSDISTPEEYEWNFLIYMGANNDLERFAIRDIKQMEKIGSTANVNILALVDWWGVYSDSQGPKSTQLYRITKNSNSANGINSELVADYGELDMTDPKSLIDFVRYAQNKYPANNTMLTLWSHGTGVYPQNVEKQGIGIDYTTGTGKNDLLTIKEVSFALSEIKKLAGEKIDIVNMDACLMQMLEVAYEIQHLTDYLVASQVLVPGRGNDYYSILKFLNANPYLKKDELVSFLVDDFARKYDNNYSTAYSAIDLGDDFAEFVASFNSLAEDLYYSNQAELAEINKIRDEMNDIDSTYIEYVDINNFVRKIKSNQEINKQTKKSINNFISSFEETLINQQALGRYDINKKEVEAPLYGLSINLPYDGQTWSYYSKNNQYASLQIAEDTLWDDFAKKLMDY